jgi:hypothetical protein
MTPTLILLGHLESLHADLLIVSPRFRRSIYRDGVTGLGENIVEVVETMNKILKDFNYEELVVLGTSGGSLAAVFSAPILGATQVAIAGPTNTGEENTTGISWEKISEAWSSDGNPTKLQQNPHLTITCGSLASKDLAFAEIILKDIPGKLHIVNGAGHNPLWELVEKGRFRP